MAFYIGFYAYAIIVHNWADQLLPQLFIEQFDTLRYNVDTLNICMKEFGLLYPPQTLFVVGKLYSRTFVPPCVLNGFFI